MKIAIYVPVPGTEAASVIAPGSAIVADADAAGGKVDAWFEGNLNKYANVKGFHDKLKIAAGRLVQTYPTKARREFDASDLRQVATYHYPLLAVRDVTDPEALAQWAGEPIGAIVGERLPSGAADWNVAAKVAEGASPVAHGQIEGVLPFRSVAGQILLFDTRAKTVEVLADDDPRVSMFAVEIEEPSRPTLM